MGLLVLLGLLLMGTEVYVVLIGLLPDLLLLLLMFFSRRGLRSG